MMTSLTTAGSASAAAVVPTRRERQRRATHDEIVSVSRRLLRSQESLSLRAVASEMGMTAPALYRYVVSYQQLLVLVAGSIFDDVCAAMSSARDRYPHDDPAAQLLASAVAFRRWALAHPDEFRLVFANPATTSTTTEQDKDGICPGTGQPVPDKGTSQFGAFFADIYLRLWQEHRFSVPSDDELEPAVLDALSGRQEACAAPLDHSSTPPGLSWIFVQAWGRLYGTVTLEVFRHMDPRLIDSGALFRSMLADCGRDLALGTDWPRLRAVVAAEMDSEMDPEMDRR